MFAPAVIDSLEFARTGKVLRGAIELSTLSRLRSELYDGSGRVEFELVGACDGQARHLLHLEVRGALHFQCQRCLGFLPYPLDLRNTLLLVPGGGTPPDQDDPAAPDSIEASPVLDVAGLVEDEILLGLPYAPRHANEACVGTESGRSTSTIVAGPFAALAALKHARKNTRNAR